MRYLSVCSGIEAATVAWHDMGWEAAAYSEIERFPSEVLKHHYPLVPNMGDMTKYKEWEIGTIGLLVGGTPCQSFSVAGLRKGLDDPRGNLALTYCGILDKFRPKWFVWENVPGVLSSGKGRDFGSFLGAVVELGYGFSYRVLDAQYFGVAQRRRRVFVVGHLGDWRPTAKVLFESESLRRDIKPSRKKGETTTTTFVPSIANCLQTTSNDYSRADGFNMIATKISGPLTARDYKGISADDCNSDMAKMVAETYYVAPKCPTITSSGSGYSRAGNAVTEHETYVAHAFKVRGGSGNGGKGYLGQDEQAFTLSTVQDQQVAVFESHGQDCRYNELKNVSSTVSATYGTGGGNIPLVKNSMAVRRLTPVECERLQGFPDNYTNIKDNCPDGPRYKALGNSMAVPVMRWIGNRIQMVEDGLI